MARAAPDPLDGDATLFEALYPDRNELTQVTVAQPDAPAEFAAAFRALSEVDREILRLVAWEGLTADELAVVFECSVNAARIRLHRARSRFTEALRAPSLAN